MFKTENIEVSFFSNLVHSLKLFLITAYFNFNFGTNLNSSKAGGCSFQEDLVSKPNVR